MDRSVRFAELNQLISTTSLSLSLSFMLAGNACFHIHGHFVRTLNISDVVSDLIIALFS